eukprot:10371662-Alexandrium_andersonii.AAC.1
MRGHSGKIRLGPAGSAGAVACQSKGMVSLVARAKGTWGGRGALRGAPRCRGNEESHHSGNHAAL